MMMENPRSEEEKKNVIRNLFRLEKEAKKIESREVSKSK